jgi:hypothetical protein
VFPLPFHLLVAMLGGWLRREQQDVIAFLREENRVLNARLQGRRLRFDDQRSMELQPGTAGAAPLVRAARAVPTAAAGRDL